MALDKDKILADIKAAAEPELKQRAQDLRSQFLQNIDDFVDSSRVHVLDKLIEEAADYEIKAVMSDDADTARQYATAAEDTLRQISVILVAEKVVAEQQIAAMIQAAALSVWDGFKTVASGILGVVIKGAITGLVGPAGGAVADAAASFLEGSLERNDVDDA